MSKNSRTTLHQLRSKWRRSTSSKTFLRSSFTVKNTWRSLLKGRGDPNRLYRSFLPGDTLKLCYESIGGKWKFRNFEGLCISKRNYNNMTRYTLVKRIKNTFIYFSFDSDNPYIIEFSKIKGSPRTGRAKLLYMYKHRR